MVSELVLVGMLVKVEVAVAVGVLVGSVDPPVIV